VFDNRDLRKAFGPKLDEAPGGWRKLHNEELRDVFVIKYYLGDQMKVDEMGGACGTCGREEHAEFWWGYRRKSIVNTVVGGTIVLKWISKS
jgi:hypothetical protein